MGSRKVNLYHEHVLVKEPGTREKTPWHHDQPYYPVDGAQIVSFWIPLDPVPSSTCPQYVAGSHRWGTWYAPKRFADSQDHANTSADYEAVPDEDTLRREHALVAYDLAPGDCIAFHGLTLHGAPGNEHRAAVVRSPRASPATTRASCRARASCRRRLRPRAAPRRGARWTPTRSR